MESAVTAWPHSGRTLNLGHSGDQCGPHAVAASGCTWFWSIIPRLTIMTNINWWAFHIFLQSTGIPAYILSEAKLWHTWKCHLSQRGRYIQLSWVKNTILATRALSLPLSTRAVCPSQVLHWEWQPRCPLSQPLLAVHRHLIPSEHFTGCAMLACKNGWLIWFTASAIFLFGQFHNRVS